MIQDDCVFCQIISGKIQTKIFYQDEIVIAFQDIRPIAPVHLLILPRQHIDSVNQVEPENELILGHLFSVAHSLAVEYSVAQSGYRLVVNSGPDAGQSVYHLHMHLIGGRHLPFRFGD
jgi:histidine triad (HIT) family protein